MCLNNIIDIDDRDTIELTFVEFANLKFREALWKKKFPGKVPRGLKIKITEFGDKVRKVVLVTGACEICEAQGRFTQGDPIFKGGAYIIN